MQDLQTKKNPLSGYFRQPKIYLRLPSQGYFYADGSLDKSENNEYPVYSMTAKDELIIKTPDALLNGQSTVEVIKSCIPAIVDPWQMPSIDVDACLIAIRIATYGESIDISAFCPACKHENHYSFNLVGYLESITDFKFLEIVEVDSLKIKIRPYSYREITQASLKNFEQQRILKIVNDQNLSDEEKTSAFNESFINLTNLTVALIANSIVSIETPEDTVTDLQQIKEFIENAPKEVFNKISSHIEEMKNSLDLKLQEVSCEECGHRFKVTITLDQTNFFAVRS